MRTHLLIAVVVSGLTIAGACKKKDEAPPPPVDAAPVVVPDAGRAAAAFPLGAGETYYGSPATTPVEWKTPDGTTVLLAVILTGKDDKGRDKGVLRAWYTDASGARKTQDLQTFELDPSIDHWAEVKPLASGKVLFRFGQADSGPTRRNAVILVWNGEAKEVRAAKRWRGEGADAEPAWLGTGEFAASPSSADNCAKIVARMVACGKDPKFREALFRREDPARRVELEGHFDTHLTSWKKPAEVKAQCARWASDEYVETHFGESTRLARLAADTKMECGFFGAEIVDEGGLPRGTMEAR
jgi:hypothetical protein